MWPCSQVRHTRLCCCCVCVCGCTCLGFVAVKLCVCPQKPRDTKNSAIKARAYRDIHAWSVSSATAQATVCAPRKTPSRACCADYTRCGRVGGGPLSVGYECGASRPAWRCPFLDSSQQELHQTCCAGCSEFDIRVYTLLYTPRLHPAPRDLLVVFCAFSPFHAVICFGQPVEGQPHITPEQRAMIDSRGAKLEWLGIEATNKQQVRDVYGRQQE